MAKIDTLREEIIDRIRISCPKIQIDENQFVEYLKERFENPTEQSGNLSELYVEDLFLAYALAQGNEQALEDFNQKYLPQIKAVLAKIGTSQAKSEDVVQEVLKKLFVGQDDSGPKVLQYNGRGRLRRYFNVVATRICINMQRGTNRETPTEDHELMNIALPGEDTELQYFKLHYREHFKQSFAAAMQELEVKERNVLRYYVLDGLNIDKIGSIYHVHRATVARWISKIREKLLNSTKQDLAMRLDLGVSQLSSILGIIQSQIDISIRKYLC
jgi:RNA polymerase sigma-70 factor (ECF subfamily)